MWAMNNIITHMDEKNNALTDIRISAGVVLIAPVNFFLDIERNVIVTSFLAFSVCFNLY